MTPTIVVKRNLATEMARNARAPEMARNARAHANRSSIRWTKMGIKFPAAVEIRMVRIRLSEGVARRKMVRFV